MIPAYENIPDAAAIARATNDPASLMPWQRYFFECFKREEYVPVPDYARFMPAMWRHATWEHLVSDTVACNGTQMATILSMVYKPRVVVEFGLDAGFTTLQFCKLNPTAQVYGVDLYSKKWDANIPTAFHAMMNDAKNLNLVLGRPSWDFRMVGKVDLCFIDACHTGTAPWRDTYCAWNNVNKNGDWCIAWDDYHENNPDVKRAVDGFIREVGMELHQVGSWHYIGNLPHERLREFGCTT